MTDKNKRAVFVRRVQGRAKLIRDLPQGARLRSWSTPRVPRAIIAAHAGRLGNLGLHQRPIEGESSTSTALQHDRRSPPAGAVDMEIVASPINHLSRWSEELRVREAARKD